jgi:hypothetical protein
MVNKQFRLNDSLYRSHPVVFTIQQTTFVQSVTSLFSQLNCHKLYATSFGLYLGHPHACQHIHCHNDTRNFYRETSFHHYIVSMVSQYTLIHRRYERIQCARYIISLIYQVRGILFWSVIYKLSLKKMLWVDAMLHHLEQVQLKVKF